MRTYNPYQQLLFSVRNLLGLRPLRMYEILFDYLNLGPLKESWASTGRPPFSRTAILRTLIYKNLRGLATLSELVDDLSSNPSLANLCGFNPQKAMPSVDRFSRFLRDIPHNVLQAIHRKQVRTLIRLGYITGKYLSIDSTSIPVHVKENNPKRFIEDKFSKKRIPKGDPECRLGVRVIKKNKPYQVRQLRQRTLYYVKQKKENKIEFFWGYKNHAVSDALAEIPVSEITKTANVADSKLFIPLFKQTKNKLKLSCKYVLADSAHDAQYIYEFARNELKAKAFIPLNPRSAKGELKFSKRGFRICLAGLEMMNWGIYYDRKKGYVRHKFFCPIRGSKKALKTGKRCPINHPSFLKGRGCIAYVIESKTNPRFAINRESGYFKKIYKLRVGSERVFSRLLTVCMQNPPVRGLNAIANHCTLAHITVLAVAIAAIKSGNLGQARFIKSFLRSKSEF